MAFVPVANGAALSLAEKRAADIVEGISRIALPDGTTAACSVGVAIARHGNLTFYDLLEAADATMYESKLRGKGVYTVREMG